MALRARVYKQYATEIEFVVAAASVATAGVGAKFGASDGEVLNAAAGDPLIGVFMTSGVAGDRVRVCLPFVAIVKVKVGAGGVATRGTAAGTGSGGFTNLALGGGTVSKAAAGLFLQSGVAGDDVSLGLLTFVGVSA